MVEEFFISDNKSKLDTFFIHSYLSEQSYWAKGRSIENVLRSIENSLCFGVYNLEQKQIGFARLVTDQVVFAWIMDVFVAKECRGKGISIKLIDHILQRPEIADVNGIGLRTNDAHALYGKFGFEKIKNPETWMLKKRV
ncbi:GNAT family N-acetyltransferase [Croceitalea rosinachiae]|uniref:GNAT family N-acetyltransferase n=1 Tax=Croceitalea rosinachiae TaxID=3075596 RepID=A0ABU3ABF5_9FLAO|nr:GNAT family N-acetyltransferase [Croceitalea sp. F388]MDT0607497.1 GNAT family N-acetyltransferase [Croceitalea sp. F388]